MNMDPRPSIGVSGLDTVLLGGVLPERSSRVRGGPDTGKVILGRQYLLAGTKCDETAFYLSDGIVVSEKLVNRRGILSGTPKAAEPS